MRRLLLVRHAPTVATRAAAFPCDEPLDERGVTEAATLAPRLPWSPPPDGMLSSPAARCLETVAVAGLPEPEIQPALAECDFGSWTGRTLADVHAADPAAAEAWMTQPDTCPHGGESLTSFGARVARWVDEQALEDGRAVAVTHGGVVKAAVVHALGAPIDAFWRIDAAPLSITELHAHDGRWTVARVNCVSNSERHALKTRHARPEVTA